MESVKSRSETGHFSGNLNLLTLDLHELAPSIDTRVSIFLQHADSIVSLNLCFDHLYFVVSILYSNQITYIFTKNNLI